MSRRKGGEEVPRTRRLRLHWRTAVALIVGALLVWVQRILSQWVSQTWIFVSFLGLLAAIVILLEWVVSQVGPGAARLAGSLARSITKAIAEDGEVRAAEAAHPRFFGWLRARLTLRDPKGLYLTLTVGAFVYFLSVFLSIAYDVATASAITRYDGQVSAVLRAFRTPVLSRLLWVFTVLGDLRVALVLTVIVVGLLLLWGRRLEALLLTVATSGGALISALAKLLFHRVRPPVSFALIKTPSSFSFPSGHALNSIILVVCLMVIVSPYAKSHRQRLLFGGVGVFVVLMTGLSRVYLGVHWMSDVFASWMLGLAWLSLCVGSYATLKRYRPLPASSAVGTLRVRTLITGVVTKALFVVVVAAAQADPLLACIAAAPRPVRLQVPIAANGYPQLDSAVVRRVPNVSQKLDGSAQEPVGLLFVGTESDLVGAYRRAGWAVADRPSVASLARAAAAAVANAPYPNAPVTPSFLDGKVEDVAFEKPVGTATVRSRHHCRWWRTRYVIDGSPLWVGTASLDSRLEIGSVIPVLTHHISPNIDAEQRFEVTQLESAGLLAVQTVRVSPATAGTNSAGDQWFTNGLATVLVPRR